MKKLTLDDLDHLLFGSAILGSGGGGDSTYFYMMAKRAMLKHGPISLLSLSDLDPEALVAPIGIMGSSLAQMEKIPNGREFISLLNNVEKSLQKKIDILMPYQVGGLNTFVFLIHAAQLGLPVLDADLMGRAFPEVHMNSCSVKGFSSRYGIVADCLENLCAIHTSEGHILEKISRSVTVSMGSWSNICFYPMSGAQASNYTIPRSVSRTLSIGKAHQDAIKKGRNPVDALKKVCKGVDVGRGKIIDIDRGLEKGFDIGTVLIQDEMNKIELTFQNEYLLAKINGEVVVTIPDILMLFDQETGSPITITDLHFGLRVDLIAIPAPDIWTTPEGLALVGPRRFGCPFDYQPLRI